METIVKDRFLLKYRRKENSKITYGTNIEGFYKYITTDKSFKNDEELLKNLTFDIVENYFYFLEDKGYKKSTINLKIASLNEFFKYAMDREIISSNFTKTIDKYDISEVKDDKNEKYIPSLNEIKDILRATYIKVMDSRNADFNNARDRFLMLLLASTGMRIEEALGIKMEDIEVIDGGYMINIDKERVKNGIAKRLPITDSVVKYFEEYKLQRMIMNEKFDSDLLFFSCRGSKLTPNAVNNTWKKLCDRVGIKGKITNHCFRHFLSNHLQSKGCEIGMIYKILGWRENGIITNYTKKANDKCYDEIKLNMCDILA